MAMDPAKAQRLNDALVAIYHYGRRHTVGRLRQLRPMGLEEAVNVITADPFDDEALRSMRLAIMDLCRTRAAGPDTLVTTLIDRLARVIAQNRRLPDADDLARRFAEIFVPPPAPPPPSPPPPPVTPDQAFLEAVRLLAPRFDPQDRASVRLVSWEAIP